ncbi:MAG: tape measure protein [Muribaculaceae bacterium]|nr:tape measure protein [Muribaculaceae bacterium]
MSNALRFEITAEHGGFLRGMEVVRSGLRQTLQLAEQGEGSIGGLLTRLEQGLTKVAITAGSAFTATKAIQFARECINVRAEVESLEISFSTLLKNEEKAGKLIKEIKEFAATTPMDMSTLAQGAQTMLAFNIEAEKIMPMLKSIGDISMGDAGKFNSLSLAFSQMSASGKLMGQDLMQMINAGFNPLSEISRKTGKSIGELKEEMEKGKISVDMITEAFLSATREGGMFNGMLTKQAEGLKGAFAYLRGAIADMMNDIGSEMEGVTVDAVNLGADLIKNYKDIGEVIGVLVSMYGAYKAAVITTAAAEAAQASGTTLLAAAKTNLTAVVQRLHAAMIMNPYGLVLAAVVALGYGIYKLTTYQSDLEKSTRQAHESASKFESQMRGEQKTLDDLKEKLESAKKGTDEWKAAKDNIVAQFGKYNSQLDEEISKTGTLAGSYESLAKAIRMSAAARAMSDYDQNSGLDEDINKSLGEIRKKLTGGKLNLVDSKGRIVVSKDYSRKDTNGFPVDKTTTTTVAGPLLEQIMAQVYDFIMTGDESKLSAKAAGYLKQGLGSGGWKELEKIRNKKMINDRGRDITAQNYGTNVKELEAFISGTSNKPEEKTESVHNKKYWENKKKQAQQDLDALSDLAAAGAEGARLKAEIAKYDKIMEDSYSAKSKTSRSSGLSAAQIASREENVAGKIADIIRKQGEERLRLEQDYEYQRWQSRIDLMSEGEAKTLAQMELDGNKERSELERRQKDEEEAELQRQMALFNAREEAIAAGNKKYAKKTFRDSDINEEEFDKIEARYEALYADLEAARKNREAKWAGEEKESMNSYLREYGSYQQKRLALSEEYDKKISEAQNEGERMSLTAQRNKAISDLDYEEWVDSGAIALAFGDLSKLSDQTVGKLITDMEKYREKVINTFDPEKIERYESALSGLREIQGEKSFGMLSSVVPDYFKNRKSVGSRMDSASKNMNALEEQRVKLLEKIRMLEDMIETTGAQGNNTEALSAKLREANVELGENEEAIKKSKNTFQLLQEEWDKLETPQAKFEALCGTISSVTDLIGGLASKGAEMCEAMGAEGAAEALGYLGDAMGSLGNIASGFAQGGLIGGIAAAAGEIMGWVGKIFSAGDNRHEKNIAELQKQIDALQNSYERLGREADKAFSTDASALIEQQDTLLRQQRVLIEQQMAEEEAKKKSDEDKMNDYRERLREIDDLLAENRDKAREAIIGEDLKSAINEFASLYAEAWGTGKDAAEKSMTAVRNIISSALSELLKKNIQPAATAFYDALAKAMGDGILTDEELAGLDTIKREIDALAAASEEQYRKIRDRYRDLDELREELTDISFDSVRDNFKSLLSDMESTAKDFTDSFTDMLRNALIKGLMDSKYEKLLDEWYKEFAGAMEDGGLSDDERERLRQQYDAIVQQGLRDRDAIRDIIGVEGYAQSPTVGGWQTMGQDQAEELNGRFTALTELEVINNSLVSEGNLIAMQILDTLRNISSLSMVTDGDTSTLREIRDMMFLSTGYLGDISGYTKQLIAIREGIDRLNDLINKRL